MAYPTLTPTATTSAITLPSGSNPVVAEAASYPFSVYTSDQYFLSGAADQIEYTYRKLGGDVLDIELSSSQVFAAYQEAVLEYSYLLNIHQAKNVIGDLLGAKTGSFDEEGQLQNDTDLEDVALKFPKFRFEYARRVGHGYSTEAGIGGVIPIYSASFDTTKEKQDYDLQSIISSSAATDTEALYYGKVKDARVNITKVYYKTPQAMWRFYGYYGGLNTVGDLSSYGQFSDDSTFQLVPPWQNKAQAMAFEDAICTRNSHYSYEIKNDRLRIFPNIVTVSPTKFWVEFYNRLPTLHGKKTMTSTMELMASKFPLRALPYTLPRSPFYVLLGQIFAYWLVQCYYLIISVAIFNGRISLSNKKILIFCESALVKMHKNRRTAVDSQVGCFSDKAFP